MYNVRVTLIQVIVGSNILTKSQIARDLDRSGVEWRPYLERVTLDGYRFDSTASFGETKETGADMDIQLVLRQQVVLHLCNLFFFVLHFHRSWSPNKIWC